MTAPVIPGHVTWPEHSPFPDHTAESAPAGSRRAMQTTTAQLGYLPAPVARLASSP